METGTVVVAMVAAYAALVATGSLVWQVYTWWDSRRPRVEVRVNGPMVMADSGQAQYVLINVVNHGELPISVAAVGIDLPGDQVLIAFRHPGNLPGTVAPRDSGQAS